MLKPKENYIIKTFFDAYIGWIIKRHFHKIQFNAPVFEHNKSILLIANHFSWWDGFLLYYINKAFFKKKFHIMVLEDTMRKIGFMQYLGAFSVAKNSRSVLESINYAADLLRDPGNSVVIFPQGKLYSNFVNVVAFQNGVQRIAGKAGSNFQYLLSASFTEGFQNKKPAANIYLSVLSVEAIQPSQIQAAYQQHYDLSKKQQTNISV